MSFGSQPELSHIEDSDQGPSKKRKADYQPSDHLLLLRSDMKKMFDTLKNEQELKFSQLNETIKDLKQKQEESIHSTMLLRNTIEDTLKDLKDKYKNLKIQHEASQIKINKLEVQLENLQKKQCETMIEISNVPGSSNENLTELICQIHNLLKISIPPAQIRQVYRKHTAKNKNIVVEYQTTQSRTQVIKAFKTYNKKNEDKLNTQSLQMAGDKTPIYISETMTPTTKQLHYLSREIKRKYNFKFCWVSNGRVFLKKSEDQPAVLVKSTEKIEEIINKLDAGMVQ